MAQNKRDKYLRSKYGISEATFKAMLDVCSGECWICRKKTNQTLNVDHDHHTNQVRGLLCFFCNKKRIGRHRREHANLFDRAATYLRSTYDWRDHADSSEIPKREVDQERKRVSRKRRR